MMFRVLRVQRLTDVEVGYSLSICSNLCYFGMFFEGICTWLPVLILYGDLRKYASNFKDFSS